MASCDCGTVTHTHVSSVSMREPDDVVYWTKLNQLNYKRSAGDRSLGLLIPLDRQMKETERERTYIQYCHTTAEKEEYGRELGSRQYLNVRNMRKI